MSRYKPCSQGSQGPACLRTGHRLLGRNPGHAHGREALAVSSPRHPQMLRPVPGAQGLSRRTGGATPGVGSSVTAAQTSEDVSLEPHPGDPTQVRPPMLSRHSPRGHLAGPFSAPHPLSGAFQVAAVGVSLPADAGDVRNTASILGWDVLLEKG